MMKPFVELEKVFDWLNIPFDFDIAEFLYEHRIQGKCSNILSLFSFSYFFQENIKT